MEKEKVIFKIDFWSVVKIFLLLFLFWFIYLIRDLVLIIFSAFIISTILIPLVDWLEGKKFSRIFSVMIVYLIIFGIFLGVIVPFIPFISSEIREITKTLPGWLEKFLPGKIDLEKEWSTLFGKIGQNFVSFLKSLFGTFSTFGIIFILVFYLTLEKNALEDFLKSFVPRKHQENFVRILGKIREEIGIWGIRLLILCFLVGLMSYLGLIIMGVNYPLALALIAGTFEIIPYFGPWFGAAAAVLVAFTQVPIKGFLVIILYLIIQQTENNIIVPQFMKGVGGLSPLGVIIAALIGGKIAGVLGIFLAIPTATIFSIIFSEWKEYKEKNLI